MAEQGDMGLTTSHKHQKCIYMRNNSHGKLYIGRRTVQTRLYERFLCDWVGWEEKHQVRTCVPRKRLRGKGRSQRQMLTVGSKTVKPQTRYPSPGVPCIVNKHSDLLGKPLGQIERIEKPTHHL